MQELTLNPRNWLKRLKDLALTSRQKQVGSYAETTVALDDFKGANLQKAYERVNAMPGGSNLGELEKRTYAMTSFLDRTKEQLNSANRGPLLGPRRKLQTELNQINQRMAELRELISQQQILIQGAEQRLQQQNHLDEQQRLEEQRKLAALKQRLLALQQDQTQQEGMLAQVQGEVNGLQSAFTATVGLLMTDVYRDAGLKSAPDALSHAELLDKVKELGPAMEQFITDNGLDQPGSANRLLLTALVEKLGKEAALDQITLVTNAKGVLTEFRPRAAKLDKEETQLQREYDTNIRAKQPAADNLKPAVQTSEAGLKELNRQMSASSTPRPQPGQAQQQQQQDDHTKNAAPTPTPPSM